MFPETFSFLRGEVAKVTTRASFDDVVTVKSKRVESVESERTLGLEGVTTAYQCWKTAFTRNANFFLHRDGTDVDVAKRNTCELHFGYERAAVVDLSVTYGKSYTMGCTFGGDASTGTAGSCDRAPGAIPSDSTATVVDKFLHCQVTSAGFDCNFSTKGKIREGDTKWSELPGLGAPGICDGTQVWNGVKPNLSCGGGPHFGNDDLLLEENCGSVFAPKERDRDGKEKEDDPAFWTVAGKGALVTTGLRSATDLMQENLLGN